MTTRTWRGGTGNITQARNWSPNGAPQPGDVLNVSNGTVNISGGQLPASETLNLAGTATVNLKHVNAAELSASGTSTVNLNNSAGVKLHNVGQGQITVNADGNNQLDVSTPGRDSGSAVTIHNDGLLTGSLNGFTTNYTIDGGQFHNVNSTAGYDGQKFTVNADVVGAGVFHLGSFHGPRGTMEFAHSVSADQTVSMDGGMWGWTDLQIDDPSAFKASVLWNTPNTGVIDLNGLAADSYSAHDGVLDFFSGDTLVDTLRFSDPSGYAFAVGQGTSTGAAGVEIYSSGSAMIPHGAALPQHVAATV